jgi:WD40 repeat protein
MQKWRFILAVFSLVSLSACDTGIKLPAPMLTQTGKTATIAKVPATGTTIPETATPTLQPTETTLPTPIPPTPILEPFLPESLQRIGAENITQLELLASLPVKEIYDLAFSPSGKLLATYSEPWDDRFNDYLEVWDLTTGSQILTIDKWDSPSGLFFPPGETKLYADNRLYDLASGGVLQILDVASQAFSADGKTYATGEYLGARDESMIKLIDTESQKEVFSLTHPGMVMYLEFSPDGRLLVGGFQVGNNYVNKIWEISTGAELVDLINYESGLLFSPDGNLAASAKDSQIILLSTDEMTYLASYGFSDPYVDPSPRGFSRDGDLLAIEDRYTIRFLVPDRGKELLNLPNECEVKFSPNGSLLVTWCYQGDLKIWGIKP